MEDVQVVWVYERHMSCWNGAGGYAPASEITLGDRILLSTSFDLK